MSLRAPKGRGNLYAYIRFEITDRHVASLLAMTGSRFSLSVNYRWWLQTLVYVLTPFRSVVLNAVQFIGYKNAAEYKKWDDLESKTRNVIKAMREW